MNDQPLIYVIIVSFNGDKWINKSVQSILQSNITNHLIIVDNNSKDNTRKIIENYFPDVQLIKLEKNIGFGKANNIGMEIALRNNADFLFLMNQDAWVDQSTIKKLVEASNAFPEYGILSPFHLSGNKRTVDYLFANCLVNDTDISLISNMYRSPDKMKEIYPTEFVNAAFWLMPKATVKRVGLFDPLFHVYGEDLDYTRRTLKNGFKIGICPKLIAYHDRPQAYTSQQSHSENRMMGKELLKTKWERRPLHILVLKLILNYIKSMILGKLKYRNKSKALLTIIKQYPSLKKKLSDS